MIQETTIVTGRKFVCDILKKEIEEKDVFAVRGQLVVSKEAASLFPEHIRDAVFLCTLASNCYYYTNPKMTGWMIIPDDGFVRLTTYDNIPFKDLEECYNYAGRINYRTCHIFHNGKFVETVQGNPVKCGNKNYGQWLEVTPWMFTSNPSNNKIRCGLAEVVNMPICGTPISGKVLLRHERAEGDTFYRDYYTVLSCGDHSIQLSGGADKEVTHA